MICERCNAVIPPTSKFCLSCGKPTPQNASPPIAKPSPYPLFVYLGIVILAWVFKDVFNSGIYTWGLMAFVAFVVFILRQQLASLFLIVDNLSVLTPFWKMQIIIPQILRKFFGIIITFILAFMLTAPLSAIFSGYGHMIFLVSLPINVLVAHLFMAPVPAKFQSK